MVFTLGIDSRVLLAETVALTAGPRLLDPDSMLLVDERLWVEREGRGRLRYCSVDLTLLARPPSSWVTMVHSGADPFRPDLTPPTNSAVDLGIFPSVAEPLMIVTLLADTMVVLEVTAVAVGQEMDPELGFLKPKETRVGAGSQLWMLLVWGEMRPFSDTLASSVLAENAKSTNKGLVYL